MDSFKECRKKDKRWRERATRSILAICRRYRFQPTFSALYPRPCRLRQRAPKFSMCGNVKEVYADGFAILHAARNNLHNCAGPVCCSCVFCSAYSLTSRSENFISIIRANCIQITVAIMILLESLRYYWWLIVVSPWFVPEITKVA